MDTVDEHNSFIRLKKMVRLEGIKNETISPTQMEREDIIESLKIENIEVRDCIQLRGKSNISYSCLISVSTAI